MGLLTTNYGGQTYTGVLDYFISLNRVYPQFYITKCSREGEDSHLHSPVISRLGEIYMNRAEAYAKLGQYANALKDLNTIRERSIGKRLRKNWKSWSVSWSWLTRLNAATTYSATVSR